MKGNTIIESNGILTIRAGQQLVIDNNYTLTNKGKIILNNGGVLSFDARFSTFINDGTIFNDGNIGLSNGMTNNGNITNTFLIITYSGTIINNGSIINNSRFIIKRNGGSFVGNDGSNFTGPIYYQY